MSARYRPRRLTCHRALLGQSAVVCSAVLFNVPRKGRTFYHYLAGGKRLGNGEPTRVWTHFHEQQLLWVLVGRGGTLLAARHLVAGPVVLSWTTREELEAGVEMLFGKAPELFLTHQPEQRTFGSLLCTSQRLGMRLRIDEFVVEQSEPLEPGHPEG